MDKLAANEEYAKRSHLGIFEYGDGRHAHTCLRGGLCLVILMNICAVDSGDEAPEFGLVFSLPLSALALLRSLMRCLLLWPLPAPARREKVCGSRGGEGVAKGTSFALWRGV